MDIQIPIVQLVKKTLNSPHTKVVYHGLIVEMFILQETHQTAAVSG